MNRFHGFNTLFRKELYRFWNVAFQTLAAPILTALLYLMIFGHVLEEHVQVFERVPYTAFLVPGLVIMSVLQNAFANSSSSLIQAKVTGSIVFVLLPPISYLEFFAAYTLGAVVRGAAVGLGLMVVVAPFAQVWPAHPLWMLLFLLIGGALFGALGIIAGIISEKFDQLAGFQNFVIMPLTMLSGVFYSIHTLPTFWRNLSHFNPVFYLVDGFRYGQLGLSDVPPLTSLLVAGACTLGVSVLAVELLRRGYKLRH